MSDVTLHMGDCRDVMAGLADGSVDAIVTDPPFGARRPSARRSAEERFDEIENNDRVFADWLEPAYRVLKDGGAAYVFTCWDRLEEWRAAMREAGFKVRNCIVWDKGIHGLGDLQTCWAPQHELILFGAKGRHILCGGRPKDIITAQRVDSDKLCHPYQKPDGAIEPLIKASTEPGDLVLDPFAGSGTTLAVALRMGRRAIGAELSPEHHANALRRIADARLRLDRPHAPPLRLKATAPAVRTLFDALEEAKP